MTSRGPQGSSSSSNPFRRKGRSPALRYNDIRYTSFSRGHQPPIPKRAVSVLLLLVAVILAATWFSKADSEQYRRREDNKGPASEIASSLAYLRKSSEPSRKAKEDVDKPSDYVALDADESDGRPGMMPEGSENDDATQSPPEAEPVGGAVPFHVNDSSQSDGQVGLHADEDMDHSSNSDLGTTDSVGGATPFVDTSTENEEAEDAQMEDEKSWRTSEDPVTISALPQEQNQDIFVPKSTNILNEDETSTVVVGESAQSMLLSPSAEAADITDEEYSENQGDIVHLDSPPNEEEDASINATSTTAPTEDMDRSEESSLVVSTEDSMQENGENTSEVNETAAEIRLGSTDEPASLKEESTKDNARSQSNTSATQKKAVRSVTSVSGLVHQVDEAINATSSQSPDNDMDQRLNISEALLAES